MLALWLAAVDILFAVLRLKLTDVEFDSLLRITSEALSESNKLLDVLSLPTSTKLLDAASDKLKLADFASEALSDDLVLFASLFLTTVLTLCDIFSLPLKLADVLSLADWLALSLVELISWLAVWLAD